jgi:ribokinase
MITVFGSINVDLTFPVRHLPRPGETVLTPSCSQAIGGKGANQAVAAARDGAVVNFIGCVGSDTFGENARQSLAAEAMDVSGLATVSGATGLACIWVDNRGHNMIAVASGANAALRADQLDATKLEPGAIVVLQMEVPAPEVETVIGRARRAGATVLLNMAPALPLPLVALRNVDVLVLNEHEAAALCADLRPDRASVGTSPEGQLNMLAGLISASVIITLGSDGAVASHAGTLFRVGALPITAVDTTAAGDCFVGVLAASLGRRASLPDAMRRAAVAASLACTSIGAQPSLPTRAQIDAALSRTTAPSTTDQGQPP